MIENVENSLSKRELRRSLLKTRQSLPLEQWREKSDRLCTHLQNFLAARPFQTLLGYTSFRQEPDLSPLFSLPYRWGLPRCVEKSLIWHHWSPQQSRPLVPGAYGILEPHPDEPRLDPESVDLILVPAVACNPQGYRLGYGGGFYDRLLADPAWAQPPTLAITFDFAHLPTLPTDSWDRPLDGLCTETGVSLYRPDRFPTPNR